MENRPEAQLVPRAAEVRVGFASTIGPDVVLDAYESYERPLFSFLMRATGSRESAQDLLQETFLRLVREVRADRYPQDVRSWLYRVAANLVASRGRRLSVGQRWLHRLVSRESAMSPELEYLDREEQVRVNASLTGLATDARVGLLMAAHGFRGPEIAAALGKSESATRTLMCRARRRLRAEICAKDVTR